MCVCVCLYLHMHTQNGSKILFKLDLLLVVHHVFKILSHFKNEANEVKKILIS